MQFNDTSNYDGLIQDCEDWTGLGRGQISGDTATLKQFTRLINNRYDMYHMLLLSSQDEWDFDDINYTDYPLLTGSLVADQQDYTFAQSDDVIKIKRIEVSYDGGTTWQRANPLDINEIGGSTAGSNDISQQFDKTKPYYDLEANTVRLYPVPDANSTNGLKIWVHRNVEKFTTADTTQQPGFDRAFHPLLSMGASMDWAIMKSKDVRGDLQVRLREMEALFTDHYGRKQLERLTVLRPSFVDYE